MSFSDSEESKSENKDIVLVSYTPYDDGVNVINPNVEDLPPSAVAAASEYGLFGYVYTGDD